MSPCHHSAALPSPVRACSMRMIGRSRGFGGGVSEGVGGVVASGVRSALWVSPAGASEPVESVSDVV